VCQHFLETRSLQAGFGYGELWHRFSSGAQKETGQIATVNEILSFSVSFLFLQLLEKDLCNTNLMQVLVKMICEPMSLGFNIGDVQVMNHLPSICVNLLKALRKSPYRDMLETHLKEKVTVQRWAFELYS
jgi:DNA-dependent protein kinase catalytic subunit